MGQILYVFDPAKNDFTVFTLADSAQTPFVEHLRLPVGVFSGGAPGLVWTDLRALLALDALAETGIPFSVDAAFRRAAKGGGTALSHRLAGTAFDLGGNLPPHLRRILRRLAVEQGRFSRVAMPYESGLALRLSLHRAFPALRAGDRGPYVFLAQDLLLSGDFFRGPLSGSFRQETVRAALRFQRAAHLPETGMVGKSDWRALAALTNGRTDAKMEGNHQD